MPIDKEMPAIMFTTDIDESFIVGSEKELRSFANHILNSLENGIEKHNLLGINSISVSETYTDPFGDVCIHGIVVTDSDQDTKRLVNRIRKSNEEPMVGTSDWLGDDGEPFS